MLIEKIPLWELIGIIIPIAIFYTYWVAKSFRQGSKARAVIYLTALGAWIFAAIPQIYVSDWDLKVFRVATRV